MSPAPRRCLVLGGARSGKSLYAETLAREWSPQPLYVATAEAGDAEMQARIAEHRARRGDGWRTREEPLALAPLTRALPGEEVVLVDCLTVWLGNLMLNGRDVDADCRDLVAAVAETEARLILVANDVGMAPLPENAMAREFAAHAGRLNRRLAAVVDRAVLLLAGLPVILKPTAAG